MNIRITYILVLLLACVSLQTEAQELPLGSGSEEEESGFPQDRKIYKFRYDDSIQVYRHFGLKNDTIAIDTAITINKLYTHHERRKDNFGLVKYPKMGEGFTPLTFDDKYGLTPEFGFKSRSYYYRDAEDMRYYDVRTPLTDILYSGLLTGYTNGQVLDFIFTANAKPNWNFSGGYKGLRNTIGIGNTIISQGQLHFTTNFHSKDYKYRMKAHFTSQDLTNEENGGMTPDTRNEYVTREDPNYDRQSYWIMNLSTRSDHVVNRLDGMRLFLDHSYDLFNASYKDPDAFRISIYHQLNWERKRYRYGDPAFESSGEAAQKSLTYYGYDLVSNPTEVDSSYYRVVTNKVGAGVQFPVINLYAQGGLHFEQTLYGFQNDKIVNGEFIPGQEKGNTTGMELYAKWFPFKYLEAEGRWTYNFAGLNKDARILDIKAKVKLDDYNYLYGQYVNASYYPSWTSRHYQSNYLQYNWYNNFKRTIRNDIIVGLKSNRILDAEVKLGTVDNYVYYDYDRLPQQNESVINIFSVKVAKDLKFWRMGWDNTVLYQTVDSEVMPLPDWVIRSSLYYKDNAFKKALDWMIGFRVNYYSAYYAPEYNPLISDYHLQNQYKVGNFPITDFFLQAKVRTMRIFLRAENITSLARSRKDWAGPSTPYEPLVIRFGLVWNFFT